MRPRLCSSSPTWVQEQRKFYASLLSLFFLSFAAHIPSPDATPWRLCTATGSVKASIHITILIIIIIIIRNLSLAII